MVTMSASKSSAHASHWRAKTLTPNNRRTSSLLFPCGPKAALAGGDTA